MQVIEEKDERLGACERLEQPADRPVCAVAVTGARTVHTRQRREDLPELTERVRVEVAEIVRREAAQVLVQRIDEDREGQLALEVGGTPRAHEPAAPVGAQPELGEQARLADPRLPLQLQRSRAPPLELGQGSFERTELSGPSNDLIDGGLRLPTITAFALSGSGFRLRVGPRCAAGLGTACFESRIPRPEGAPRVR